MLKKLYQKSQLVFALAWIIAYVILASAGDHISEALGISKIMTFPILRLVLFSGYSSSGCWPSWASHLHSVSSIWVKTALKEDSSGEQA